MPPLKWPAEEVEQATSLDCIVHLPTLPSRKQISPDSPATSPQFVTRAGLIALRFSKGRHRLGHFLDTSEPGSWR
jgi:hypothetical protein